MRHSLLFTGIVLLLPLQAKAQNVFALDCTFIEPVVQSMTLVVDTQAKTVNGAAAEITDTVIKLAKENSVIVVNRYTGQLDMVGEKQSPRPGQVVGSGRCHKVEKRRF